VNHQCRAASILLLGAILAVSCAKLSPQQEHFSRAYDAYNKGDFASVILYLKPLVEAENPAAELLMARMYANGEGVQADPGKADLLRNLAAFQIFKKKNLTPGELRRPSDTLSNISDRLDYYVGATDRKEQPAQSLTQVLDSLDVHSLMELQKSSYDPEQAPAENPPSESGHPPDVNVDRAEITPQSVPEPATPQKDESVPAPIPTPVPADSRASDQISLGYIRQAAEGGDSKAMGLLSAAYKHGFYGLTPSTTEAVMWKKRSREALHHPGSSLRDDPLQQVPLEQLWFIIAGGVSLIGTGLWLLFRRHSW